MVASINTGLGRAQSETHSGFSVSDLAMDGESFAYLLNMLKFTPCYHVYTRLTFGIRSRAICPIWSKVDMITVISQNKGLKDKRSLGKHRVGKQAPECIVQSRPSG